jgi:hypothetical protein
MSNYKYRNQSIFGPVFLIGIGTLFLLNNFGIVGELYWVNLARLWPVFLISLGIKIIFQDNLRWVHGIFSAVTALFLVGSVLIAPPDNWLKSEHPSLHQSYVELIENTRSAILTMEVDSSNIVIDSTSTIEYLGEFDFNYQGELIYLVDGNTEKDIFISLDQEDFDIFNLISLFGDEKLASAVSLSPSIPFEIEINLGSGTAELNLDKLQIERLSSNSGSGKINVTLPAGNFPVSLNSGSGIIQIDVPEANQLDMEIGVGSGIINVTLEDMATGDIDVDSGSGSISIELPDGIAVMVIGDGNGSVRVPSDYYGNNDDSYGSSMEGQWFSPEFNENERYLTIYFDVGSGSFRITER